jgi:hypothetical protein
MWTSRRIPSLYVGLACGAAVSVALSLLVLSGAFEPRTTVAGSIFFDACDAGRWNDSCIRLSHSASGVAIEYRTVGLLPVSFATHTDRDGRYKLDLPPGHYRVIIHGCKSWLAQTTQTTSPPETVIEREPINPDFRYTWVIHANGVCEIGAMAL